MIKTRKETERKMGRVDRSFLVEEMMSTKALGQKKGGRERERRERREGRGRKKRERRGRREVLEGLNGSSCKSCM